MRSPMSKASRALLTIIVAIFFTSCRTASQSDLATLERYGGSFVPTGEGSAVNGPPFDFIHLGDKNHIITDDTFAELLPTLKRLPARHLVLTNQPVTDRSIDAINQL